MHLVVGITGQVRCVYAELIRLAALGAIDIRRASHVEPDSHGRWFADLAPVGGPRLGPYGQRSSALQDEQTWLEEHWLPAQPQS